MVKWRKYKQTFDVRVSYRAGKTRGTIAVPAPILQAWANPTHIRFSAENGEAKIEPVTFDCESKSNGTTGNEEVTK